MKSIVIVSLHFSPGFIGHMQAWYKMCQQCDLTPFLYIDSQYTKYFENSKYKYVTNINGVIERKPEYAVVQNTGIENIPFFRWCSKNKCKIFYILHEPYMGLSELLKDGTYCVKQAIACILNVWLCYKAQKVIICSDYAEKNCRKYMKNVSRKMVRFPLIFSDEFNDIEIVERKYFSLIGTYAVSKGSDLFLKFVKESVKRGYHINFMIATRSDLEEQLKDATLKRLVKEGRLVVKHGRNMTTKEINFAYKQSICCWNGYRRSTQSGVLPNAFMMGTPVLATRLGSFEEFVIPGATGEFIDNEDSDSIYNAYLKVKRNEKHMSETCRKYFVQRFYYKNQKEMFEEILAKE